MCAKEKPVPRNTTDHGTEDSLAGWSFLRVIGRTSSYFPRGENVCFLIFGSFLLTEARVFAEHPRIHIDARCYFVTAADEDAPTFIRCCGVVEGHQPSVIWLRVCFYDSCQALPMCSLNAEERQEEPSLYRHPSRSLGLCRYSD